MENYLEKLVKESELRGLAKSSKAKYLKVVEDFLNYNGKDPEQMDLEDIKKFLLHLQHLTPLGRTTKRSPNTINTSASALSFFFRNVLDKDYHGQIPRMKAPRHIPTILTSEEINSMINGVYNVFWKAVLMMLYTTGMRQSELRNLKTKDIDSNRMVIYIRNAKGFKDRQAALSQTMLGCLRTYWRLFRYNSVESDYVFIPNKNSYDGDLKKSLSHTAVGYIIRRAIQIAGVNKKVTPHDIRHTFAVHLVEKNVHFRYIQYLLGHEDPKTTSRYTRIADVTTFKIPELINYVRAEI